MFAWGSSLLLLTGSFALLATTGVVLSLLAALVFDALLGRAALTEPVPVLAQPAPSPAVRPSRRDVRSTWKPASTSA